MKIFSKYIYPIFCLILCLAYSSCKKDPINDPNNPPTQLDTLAGAWIRESGNLYNQKGFQNVFELDGQIFSLNQAYTGNSAKIYKYSHLAPDFTLHHSFTGNMPFTSYCQSQNVVYCMMDYTTSTGGFGATYNYKYVLFKITSQSVTQIAELHNPLNISLSSHALFTQGSDVYFAGYSKIHGTNNNGITVYKLDGDSLKYHSSKPTTQTAPEIINIPNGGAWVLLYNVINGDYSNIDVLKIDQGQISTYKSGLQANGHIMALGGHVYNVITVPHENTPEYKDVFLENIQTGQRKLITKIVSYLKYYVVRNDKIFISIASQNHSTDNHFIVVDNNGNVNLFPMQIPGFDNISNFKEVKFFGESDFKYYLVLGNISDNVLYSFAK